MTTLLRPAAGWSTVLGRDVVREAAQVRRLIGLTGLAAGAVRVNQLPRCSCSCSGTCSAASLPMTRGAVLAGRTEADLIRNFFVLMLMIGIGFAMGFRIHNGALPLVLVFAPLGAWRYRTAA